MYESLSHFTVTMTQFQYVSQFESGEIISTLLFSPIKVAFKPLPNFGFEWWANLFFITICHDTHRQNIWKVHKLSHCEFHQCSKQTAQIWAPGCLSD